MPQLGRSLKQINLIQIELDKHYFVLKFHFLAKL